MKFRLPASLNVTVPLILLAFAAILSAVNLLYHVPKAERAAEDTGRERLAQEMSRLQSTLEYLLLKGDFTIAQHEIEVLAHDHDVILAALTNEQQQVVAATKRAWLGRSVAEVLPQFDLDQAAGAIRERRAEVTTDANADVLLGYAGVLIGGEREELRPYRHRHLVSRLRLATLQDGSSRAGSPAIVLLGGMGDRTCPWDVARILFPADPPDCAAGARC
jgi:two-component system NtrC family sensor kinase